MRPRTRLTALGWAATTALVAAAALAGGPAAAAPATAPGGSASGGHPAASSHTAPDYNGGKLLPFDKKSLAAAKDRPSSRSAAPQERLVGGDHQVGDTMVGLALNQFTNQIGFQRYVLRGLGEHIQVWVAQSTAFPPGDCRNTLGLTDVTDAQVAGFVHEFDTNIYPKESAAFSVPPDRDGSNAPLSQITGESYQVGPDQADDITVLVDNVRDANYYQPSSPAGQSYVTGFFYSGFNELFNRNVMTIDAFDWLHRTGANPPDDRDNPAYAACAAALGQSRPLGPPTPHKYESVFAHEYQHLLEYYEDPDEVDWVNEGLSAYAQSLVGYVDPAVPPTSDTADAQLRCFSGDLPPAVGGPENSLTLWGDQGGQEILCDYGAAYSFMEYLSSRYGPAFLGALHREDANGLAGVEAVLRQLGAHASAMDTVHDWAAAVALDAVLEQGRKLTGGRSADFSASTLSSSVTWDNPQAYAGPGAPPNGSDYVRLRDASGGYLTAKQISSISFAGNRTLAPDPVEWTVDTTPPDTTTAATTCGAVPDGTGAAALSSGCGPDLDRSLVREVAVPATGGTLTFQALWDTERGSDFGYVQVSTDGGATWTSLSTEDTTNDADPGAIASVQANVPGFTGDSGGWRTQHASLTPYAGQTVLLGFRTITDPFVDEAGFFVRGIDAAGTALPSDGLAGWHTISDFHPDPVPGFTVQLIGYDDMGRAWIHRLPLDASLRGTLSGAALNVALGNQATTVAAIVMEDDPSETVTKPAGYTLTVNGVVQPGG